MNVHPTQKPDSSFADFDNRYLKDGASSKLKRIALSKLPIINISPFVAGGTDAERAEVARQLHDACVNIGFCYITGHGFSEDELERMISVSHKFFESPRETKLKYDLRNNSDYLGYIDMGGGEAGKDADIRENFRMNREVIDGEPDGTRDTAGRTPWPAVADLAGFTSSMQDYIRKQTDLLQTLMRIFAKSLDLPEAFFDAVHRYPYVRLALNYYPPVDARKLGNTQWGISPHTDYGSITILLQDAVGGLEVRNFAGEWVEVPYVPGSFVVNIGDVLATWTNDLYASNLHRAFNPAPGRARLSVAFFASPNSDAKIDCLPSCYSDGNPARYQSFIVKDFIDQLIAEGHDNNKVGFSKRTMERLARK